MDYTQTSPNGHPHSSLVQIPTPNSYLYGARRRVEGEHSWPNTLIPRKRSVKTDRYRLESFHFFSMFPTEIRLNVWRFTCFPRAVEVELDIAAGIPGQKCFFKQFRAHTQLPATFSVCTESRAVVLPFYKLSFGSALCEDLAPSTIYFNADVDTLFFRFIEKPEKRIMACKSALKSFIEHSFNTQCGHQRLDMESVKRIAISHRAVDRSSDFAGVVPHLGLLPTLEEFIVVAERHETPYGSQIVLEEPAFRGPEIANLQEWVSRELEKNQTYVTARSRDNIAALVVKVMEAEYESMYPPPVRRSWEIETEKLKEEEVETPEPHIEAIVAAENWSANLLSSLDDLSLE